MEGSTRVPLVVCQRLSFGWLGSNEVSLPDRNSLGVAALNPSHPTLIPGCDKPLAEMVRRQQTAVFYTIAARNDRRLPGAASMRPGG